MNFRYLGLPKKKNLFTYLLLYLATIYTFPIISCNSRSLLIPREKKSVKEAYKIIT